MNIETHSLNKPNKITSFNKKIPSNFVEWRLGEPVVTPVSENIWSCVYFMKTGVGKSAVVQKWLIITKGQPMKLFQEILADLKTPGSQSPRPTARNANFTFSQWGVWSAEWWLGHNPRRRIEKYRIAATTHTIPYHTIPYYTMVGPQPMEPFHGVADVWVGVALLQTQKTWENTQNCERRGRRKLQPTWSIAIRSIFIQAHAKVLGGWFLCKLKW